MSPLYPPGDGGIEQLERDLYVDKVEPDLRESEQSPTQPTKIAHKFAFRPLLCRVNDPGTSLV